ncbi:MAG TPA: MCE family protein [Mycobacteriales bacterium]|nr:MCE family protein [Mycobacteriales bacterium]
MRGKTLGAAIKLIIFAVVTIMATAVLGVVVSNRTFGSTKVYKANFTDVTGLMSGNDVRMAGVRVGTVKSVKSMSADGKNFAQVSFDVNEDVAKVAMTTTTVVKAQYLNLVGQRYLNLVEKPGNSPQQDPDVVIPLDRTTPALDLTALFNGFKPLFRALSPEDVNKFALEIIKTLQGEGGTVQQLLAQTASLTNTVGERDAAIGQVIDNLLTVLSTVQKRDAGLGQTITQLQRLVSGLAGDRDAIAESLTNINTLATSSAKLLTGIRPVLPADLRNLQQLARVLNTTKDPVDKTKNALAAWLQREPAKLTRIIRTGSYGAYFNFWLCSAGVVGLPVQLQPAPSQSPSCPAVN